MTTTAQDKDNSRLKKQKLHVTMIGTMMGSILRVFTRMVSMVPTNVLYLNTILLLLITIFLLVITPVGAAETNATIPVVVAAAATIAATNVAIAVTAMTVTTPTTPPSPKKRLREKQGKDEALLALNLLKLIRDDKRCCGIQNRFVLKSTFVKAINAHYNMKFEISNNDINRAFRNNVMKIRAGLDNIDDGGSQFHPSGMYRVTHQQYSDGKR